MDFSDTPEQAAFRVEARAWIAEHAPEALRPQLETSIFGKPAFDDMDAYLREARAWQAKKYSAGWACLGWPKEYGGRGASPIERVIWREEEGPFAVLSSPFSIGHGMCAPTLMTYASEEQKRRYLPAMASGEEIWSQLFSEPCAGSDLAGLQTRAESDGAEWVINGQKIWSSGAHYSAYAILITRTDPEVPKHQGLTMFFVDLRSPGIEIRPIKQITGDAHFNEVFFEDVRIPDSQRMGERGEGWRVSLTTLMNERLSIGGNMPTGFEDLLAFACEARTEGSPLIDDRAVRDKLADWAVKASGLKYTGARLISAVSRGEAPGPEASIGKLVAGSTMQEISSFALDLQELSGVVSDPALAAMNAKFQTMLLRSAATRLEGGSDEILRNIIAERVLGLPGDVRVDRNIPFSKIPTG